jgi:hypothetical protein
MDFGATGDHASCYGVNLAFARFSGWGAFLRHVPEMEPGVLSACLSFLQERPPEFPSRTTPGVSFKTTAGVSFKTTAGVSFKKPPEFPSGPTAGVSFKAMAESGFLQTTRLFHSSLLN